MRYLFAILFILIGFQTSYANTFNSSNSVNAQDAYSTVFNQVGQRDGISPLLLYAIAYHESALNKNAINKNTNGSYDYGLMQINSSNLGSLGLNTTDVFEPYNNVNAGAHVLYGCFQRFGVNRLAIDCYNKGYNRNILSEHSVYVQQVMAIFDSLSTTGKLANPAKISETQKGALNQKADDSITNLMTVGAIIVFILLLMIFGGVSGAMIVNMVIAVISAGAGMLGGATGKTGSSASSGSKTGSQDKK